MSKVKFFSGKKVLSAALALVMTASAMPMVFAAEEEAPLAPTGPVKEGTWTGDSSGDYSSTKDIGNYVSIQMNKQEFTFVQTKDNEEFCFEFYPCAKKNASINYAWILAQSEDYPQTFTTPIGQSTSVVWEKNEDGDNIGGLDSGYLKGTTVTVNFVADGADVYNTSLRLWFDSGMTSVWPPFGDRAIHSFDIPFKITVLDQRALLAQIAVADGLMDQEENYSEEAWENFLNAYDVAVAATTNYDLTQTEITNASETLRKAIVLLDQTQVNVDLAKLKTAVTAAQAKVDEADETGYYVEANVKELKALISEVEEFIAQNPSIGDRDQVIAYTEQLNDLVANLPLAPADYAKLNELKAWAEAFLNDTNQTDKYTPDSVNAVEKAYKDAKLVPDGMTKKDGQKRIDAAASTLESAKNALEERQGAVTSVSIKLAGNDSANQIEGNVIYHMTPWYKTWTSQSVDLTFETNAGADIADVTWEAANWSADKPEAKIENYEAGTKDREVTVRPTFGIGPRSFWIKVTVTDVWGTKVTSDPIKVRFINYDWQK